MDEQHENSNGSAAAPERDLPAREAALCPYCGSATADPEACESCGGLLEPLSRQATQNAMGPWFIRDDAQPFRPGCSLATLKRLVARAAVKPDTVIRGPSTRQFWSLARNAPGVAHLMGECHNCHGPAEADEYICRSCGAVFVGSSDRQSLGLAPVRLLPGEAPPEVVAESATVRPAPMRHAPTPVPLPVELNPAPASQPAPVAHKAPAPPTVVAAAAGPSKDTLAVSRLSRELSSLRRVVVALAGAAVVLLGAVVVLLLRTAPQPTPPASPPEPAPVIQAPTPTVDWKGRLDEAVAAGAAGTTEALHESLRRLEAIQAEAPADQAPKGLAEALDTVRRRLDEAVLRKFME